MIGAGILYTTGKKVLLLKRSADSKNPLKWALVGGKREKNETPLETAKRESKEEIGFVKGKKIRTVNGEFVVFIFKVEDTFKPNLNDEHLDYAWVDLKDVPEYDLHPKLRKKWEEYLKIIKSKLSFNEWINGK